MTLKYQSNVNQSVLGQNHLQQSVYNQPYQQTLDDEQLIAAIKRQTLDLNDLLKVASNRKIKINVTASDQRITIERTVTIV